MRSREAKFQAQVEEFIAAAQDLHASGEAGFYVREVGAQIARNDEIFMRRHDFAKKVLGFASVNIGEPNKSMGTLYPVTARLEHEGKLESYWEDEDSEKPRRRVYRLVEEPGALKA